MIEPIYLVPAIIAIFIIFTVIVAIIINNHIVCGTPQMIADNVYPSQIIDPNTNQIVEPVQIVDPVISPTNSITSPTISSTIAPTIISTINTTGSTIAPTNSTIAPTIISTGSTTNTTGSTTNTTGSTINTTNSTIAPTSSTINTTNSTIISTTLPCTLPSCVKPVTSPSVKPTTVTTVSPSPPVTSIITPTTSTVTTVTSVPNTVLKPGSPVVPVTVIPPLTSSVEKANPMIIDTKNKTIKFTIYSTTLSIKTATYAILSITTAAPIPSDYNIKALSFNNDLIFDQNCINEKTDVAIKEALSSFVSRSVTRNQSNPYHIIDIVFDKFTSGTLQSMVSKYLFSASRIKDKNLINFDGAINAFKSNGRVTPFYTPFGIIGGSIVVYY